MQSFQVSLPILGSFYRIISIGICPEKGRPEENCCRDISTSHPFCLTGFSFKSFGLGNF